MTTPTPLRKQYLNIKRQHPDALLLFRIGDFYEAFDDDAQMLARELNIVLTSKPMGKSIRVPLAGIPHQSLERHLATLIARGHRVAICEQLTTAAVKGVEAGRGLIEREVVRVITPGTVFESNLLQSKTNNYIAATVVEGRLNGIAYADVTTGEFAATELESSAAIAELQRIAPAELLVPQNFDSTSASVPGHIKRCDESLFDHELARSSLLEHFGAKTLAAFGLARRPVATRAAGALVAYLRTTQRIALEQLTRLSSYDTRNFMLLDEQTMRSLEIFESASEASTLLETLDKTVTAMGGRLLRRWLRQPLLDVAEIVRRQEHVAWFVAQTVARDEVKAALNGISDLERLLSRTRAGIAAPQELLALGRSLEIIPAMRDLLQRETKRFGALLTALPSCEVAAQLVSAAIADQLSSRAKTSFIREGFSEELDRLRGLLRDGRKYLAEMERRERARTGIKSLRVGYNKVFGYFIEVTRPNLHLVTSDYTRKQTLANGERYVTLELKEYETLVVNAQDRITELEGSLFRHVCHEVGKHYRDILGAASTLAYLDAITSFAEAAAVYNYVRPNIVDSGVLRIKENRHPVLERRLEGEGFVTNDVELDNSTSSDATQIALITGPNMSGKSTYLRQTAISVLMAQIGCFVPASEATIGLCDRLFTRTGLYDRIGSGESTFMTEMIETAEILHHATPRSLILLDELGRGTSTYDGLAVARAVLEYIHNHPQLGAKTLFATHYHELTELEEVLPRLKNFYVEIVEQGSDLVFLYKVNRGSAQKSYGVYAAKLAGLPRPVVRRAEKLLEQYETKRERAAAGATEVSERHSASLAAGNDSEIAQALLELDVNVLSPVEALMKLYELRRVAEKEAEKNVRVFRRA